MDVAYSYTKKRYEFGVQCKFQNMEAEIINSFEPTNDFEKGLVFRNPSIIEVDTTPSRSETTIGTERVIMVQKGQHHAEGGWPKEVDIDDIESKNRFRKKAKAGPLSEGLKKVGPVIVESVRQNNTINLYENFFDGESENHSTEPPSAKGLAKFRDPNEVKRQVTQICWTTEGPVKIAAAYSILNFQDKRFSNDKLSNQSYVWDINNPNTPEYELCPVSPLCCIKFGKLPDTIVGGSYNGLISFFDIRKSGKTPCEQSQIENSHHDPVYDVCWIQSKTGTQCASVSTDGRLLWWDIRKLSEPSEIEELLDETNQTLGGSSMAYVQEAGPTKYLVGTEQGCVLSLNVRNKKQGGALINVFDQGPGRHHAPIYSIERNPVHHRFFLTVGDWTARMWTEDLKTPIMITRYTQSYLTSGCWSPSRPSVFYLTRKDGVVDVWDYFQTQSEVVYSHKVGDVALKSIGIHPGQRGTGGKLVGIGDEDGTISLLEVCDSLSQPRSNEKAGILGVFERESKREKNLIIRIKDMKRRQQQIQSEKKAESDINKESSAEKMLTIIKKIDDDFKELTKVDEELIKAGEDIDFNDSTNEYVIYTHDHHNISDQQLSDEQLNDIIEDISNENKTEDTNTTTTTTTEIKTEPIKTETKIEEIKQEEPKPDKKKDSKSDERLEPLPEETKKDENKKEERLEPLPEETKKEERLEPLPDETKKEETKVEETKKDETKVEEIKTDETKTDQPPPPSEPTPAIETKPEETPTPAPQNEQPPPPPPEPKQEEPPVVIEQPPPPPPPEEPKPEEPKPEVNPPSDPQPPPAEPANVVEESNEFKDDFDSSTK